MGIEPYERGIVTAGPHDMPPPSERRPKLRKRVLLTGLITYAGADNSLECTIRDLSDPGARIDVRKHTQLPSDFYLIKYSLSRCLRCQSRLEQN